MCQDRDSTTVTVKIPSDLSCDGVEKLKEVAIDSCIAELVKALQDGGVDMRGSCCGHGKTVGHIDLQDGRGLLVLSPRQNQHYLIGGLHAISELIQGRQLFVRDMPRCESQHGNYRCLEDAGHTGPHDSGTGLLWGGQR